MAHIDGGEGPRRIDIHHHHHGHPPREGRSVLARAAHIAYERAYVLTSIGATGGEYLTKGPAPAIVMAVVMAAVGIRTESAVFRGLSGASALSFVAGYPEGAEIIGALAIGWQGFKMIVNAGRTPR